MTTIRPTNKNTIDKYMKFYNKMHSYYGKSLFYYFSYIGMKDKKKNRLAKRYLKLYKKYDRISKSYIKKINKRNKSWGWRLIER